MAVPSKVAKVGMGEMKINNRPAYKIPIESGMTTIFDNQNRFGNW